MTTGILQTTHRADTVEAYQMAVERVVGCMKLHLDQPLNLDHLAHAAAISKFHFVRVFEEITGTTPHHFLACLRIQRAKELLLNPDGRLVILDAGFMVELDDATRRSFAEFFLAIAFRDGRAAARIVRETATRLPSNLNVEAFDEDISDLIERVGGLKARDFQVVDFVGELFAIQRKHGIYGTSKFTMIILSLLVYEGVAKQRFPDLDFQKEAVPFVIPDQFTLPAARRAPVCAPPNAPATGRLERP